MVGSVANIDMDSTPSVINIGEVGAYSLPGAAGPNRLTTACTPTLGQSCTNAVNGNLGDFSENSAVAGPLLYMTFPILGSSLPKSVGVWGRLGNCGSVINGCFGRLSNLTVAITGPGGVPVWSQRLGNVSTAAWLLADGTAIGSGTGPIVLNVAPEGNNPLTFGFWLTVSKPAELGPYINRAQG